MVQYFELILMRSFYKPIGKPESEEKNSKVLLLNKISHLVIHLLKLSESLLLELIYCFLVLLKGLLNSFGPFLVVHWTEFNRLRLRHKFSESKRDQLWKLDSIPIHVLFNLLF